MARTQCRDSVTSTSHVRHRREIKNDSPLTRALAYVIVGAFTLFVVTFFVAVSVALIRWVV